MGNSSIAKEEMRDARVLGWLASSLQDLRHGVVLLRRDAGVSALIVLVLALGIGGNAAIFTLLEAAFLDPLPYRDARRLVTIMESTGWNPSVSEFVEIRERTRTLDQVAFAEHLDMQLTGTGEPARVFAARVSASFFPLLGVNPSLGRTFFEEENRPGRTPAVILTDAFWRSRTGADPAIVGRSLRLDGQPAEVVGVLPPAFHFDYPTLRIPEPVDIYVSYPLETSGLLSSSGSGKGAPVRVIARMRPGVNLAQAQADLRSIASAIVHDHPTAYRTREGQPGSLVFVTLPLRDAIVGTERSLLWLLLGGVGVLLLIACANAAQLLLARSLERGQGSGHPLGSGREPPPLDPAVSSGRPGARGLRRRRRPARGKLDRPPSRPSAARTQSASRFRPFGRPRDRLHARRFAGFGDPVRHHPGSEGQPLDSRPESQRARHHGRGKPLAPRHDCPRSGALRVPAFGRRPRGAEPLDVDLDAHGLRSRPRAGHATEAAGAFPERRRSAGRASYFRNTSTRSPPFREWMRPPP